MNAAESSTTSVEQSIQQLRVLVAGLGAGLVLVSVTFSGYVWKQNRNLSAQLNARTQQMKQFQGTVPQFERALNELAKYSRGKPELVAILSRHGIQLTDPPPAASQPASK